MNEKQRRPVADLSIAEKILLVQDLWDSIAAEHEALELTEAQRVELDRRLDAYEAEPGEFVTWEQIQATLRKAAS